MTGGIRWEYDSFMECFISCHTCSVAPLHKKKELTTMGQVCLRRKFEK